MRKRISAAIGAASVSAVLLTGCASTRAVHTSELGGPGVGDTSAVISQNMARTTSESPIVTWYHQVSPKIMRAEASIALAQRAVNRSHHRGLDAACLTIKRRAQVVQTARSAPDQIVRHAIDREMTHFVKGANYCISDELVAAGRSVDFGHYWSKVTNNRLLALLRRHK